MKSIDSPRAPINPTPAPRPSVRFWTYHRGWVRLKINAGQRLEHTSGGPTEEGYSARSEVWRFDGFTLHLEADSWGRDCDGAHRTQTNLHTRHLIVGPHPDDKQFDIGPRPTPRPDWIRGQSQVYDQFAQAAGY